MTSFTLLSSSSTARTLAANETGFVALGSTLYTSMGDSVTVTGSASVTAMGSIVADGGNALDMSSATDFLWLTVGQEGALSASRSQAITGFTNNQLILNNSGLISGGAEAISLSAQVQAGVVADYHIANSGTIQSSGFSTTENTIEFTMPTSGIVNLGNTGLILNGGAGGAILIVGGRLDMTNSGTIQCRSTINAITSDLGNDVIDNSGTIIGGIALNDGNDTLSNQGRITGNLFLGNGSDRVVNTGTILGVVNLSDVLTTGAINDTVVNYGLISGDVLLGNGNDTYRSRGGQVDGTVFGGAGDDLYIVDQADLAISDSNGNDTVRASVDFALSFGMDRLEFVGPGGRIGTGNTDANTIVGGVGDDLLRGAGGADMLFDGGGAGNDTLAGGDGDDVLISNNGDDVVEGGGGFDTLTLSSGAVILGWAVNLGSASAVQDGVRSLVVRGIERVEGDFGNDTMTGNALANHLSGGFGADRLNGGGGDDTLVGGGFADALNGGAGADVFRFETFGDSSVIETDRISDFVTGVDHIELPKGDYVFLGTGAFTGAADEIRFVVAGGVTTIEVRLLGASVNAMEIELTGSVALTASDFVF